MKTLRNTIVTLLIAIASVIIFKLYLGYWPIPIFFKKIYYAYNYNGEPEITGSFNMFNINREGEEAIIEIDNKYELPNVVDVTFNQKQNTLDLDYSFSGIILLSIIKDNEIIYKNSIKSSEESFIELDNIGHPKSIYGFRLVTLPFPVGDKNYNDITLRVKVIKADKILSNSIESVNLAISPDTSL